MKRAAFGHHQYEPTFDLSPLMEIEHWYGDHEGYPYRRGHDYDRAYWNQDHEHPRSFDHDREERLWYDQQ